MVDTKKSDTKVNSFGDIFDDSDDENEIIPDPINDAIRYQYQDKFNVEIRHLKEFLNCPNYITNKNNPNTNVVDMYSMPNSTRANTYCIPDDKIAKMFKYVECCRRSNSLMMMYEKQQEYSGIMIDFDICQTEDISRLNNGVYYVVIQNTLNILRRFLNLDTPAKAYDSDSFNVHFAIIRKQYVKYNKEKNYYKDGFHLLIPGVKIKREVKRFLLNKIKEENIYESAFNVFKPSSIEEDGEPYTSKNFVDKNSAHVPVFFLGSHTKPGSEPYILESVNKILTMPSDIINPKYGFNFSGVTHCPEFNANDLTSKIVLSHELSLNWETENKYDKTKPTVDLPWIQKRNFEIKEEYASQVNVLKSTVVEDTEDIISKTHGAFSILNIHDPDAQYIQELLNTLSPFRYTDFCEWFKVLCVLAHTSKSYKPLAETFSMKSVEKFNQMDFEHHWQSAMVNKQNKLSIGSLHYWAKLDNPLKYEEVRQRSIVETVFSRVYHNNLDGCLQHYDVAKILFMCLRHKYVFDISDGGIWYEFIIQEDPHRVGEIYKWRTYSKTPNSIKIYTSEIISLIFGKVLNRIDGTIEGLSGDNASKYHALVKTNLKSSCRKLNDSGFKTGVAKECEQVFEKLNFSSTLDKDPEILGVGNGILKLGSEVEFVTGYHNYSVSQYTAVDYVAYNPNNPITKKLLIAIRNLFPDDEPDTFEFMMHYFASALDGKKKESLLLLLVGNGSNGKSFLVELFKETIGSMYAVKMPLSFLTSRPKNSESATPALMMLINARFAYYSETEKSEILHLAKVKELTGQETLGGRGLFGDYKTFKPTCHHLVTSNYDFAVNGNDHGTWRRLKRITMRIKFCKKNVDNYNENNPHERIADASMGSQWPEDPEVKSAFLSILCHYYESLQNKYNGIVENVPHPNIKIETEAFRDRQDRINHFINIRFVKTTDPTHQIDMPTIIEKYTKWYDSLYPDDKEYKKSVGGQFENSKLSKIFEKTKVGICIKGYRILDTGAEPEEDEQFFMDIFTIKKNKDIVNVVESAVDFHARLCIEYSQEQISLNEKHKKEMQELNKIKFNEIKESRKNITNNVIKPKAEYKPLVSDQQYDISGFKKNKLTELSTNDIKDMANDNGDSEEESDSEESS